jgi:hypothetical protein
MRDEPGRPRLVLLIDSQEAVSQDEDLGCRPVAVWVSRVGLDHLATGETLRFQRALDWRRLQHLDQIAMPADRDRTLGIGVITVFDRSSCEHPLCDLGRGHTRAFGRPVAVLSQEEPPRIRPKLPFLGTAIDLEQIDVVDACLVELIKQTARRLADDDSRAFCPPGQHAGIDALLVGHGDDQEPDASRLELVAE